MSKPLVDAGGLLATGACQGSLPPGTADAVRRWSRGVVPVDGSPGLPRRCLLRLGAGRLRHWLLQREQICVSGACRDLGPSCDELWPCAAGFACDATLGRCVPGATKCEYRPPVGVFGPKVKWEWTGSSAEPTYNQVMMAPMVANLSDDNADGKIDRDDVPDVVFITFAGSNYHNDGVLRAISGDSGKDCCAVTDPALRTHPGTQVALADLDSDRRPEIVACARTTAGDGLEP